jgi:hypothetical protein
MDGLLFCCEAVSALWNAFFYHFGFPWLVPRRVTRMHVGGPLVALKVLLCERWCLVIFYGVFGGT